MDANEPVDLLIDSDAQAISLALRNARITDTRLAGFPGPVPHTLEAAYAVQSLSIDAWSDYIVGWKVGGVPANDQIKYRANRLAGPIFSRTMRRASQDGVDASVVHAPAFQGFVAIEAEWMFELGDCSGLYGTEATEADIARVIRAAYMGVEIASSPIPDINSYGPAAVVSDFGNNHGLVIGAAINDWSSEALCNVPVSVEINGETVGADRALAGLDGPLGAVKFLIEHLSSRGRTDLSGQFVSSGAITGVHETTIGSSANVHFGGVGGIALRVVPIAPAT